MSLSKFTELLRKNGGASYNLQTNEISPKKGYFVSLPNQESVFPLKQLTEDKVTEYAFNKSSFLTDDTTQTTVFLGGWVDKGTVYLDVSIRYNDKRNALRMALLYNQKALYDANEAKAIFLPSRQKTGTFKQINAHVNQLVDKLMSE